MYIGVCACVYHSELRLFLIPIIAQKKSDLYTQ